MTYETVNLSAVIGYIVQTERKIRGLTQADLAEDAGIHSVALSKIERGVQRDIGVVTLHHIAQALSDYPPRVTVGDIVEQALTVQEELLYELEHDTLPTQHAPKKKEESGGGAVLAGAALAGFALWLATRKK